LFLSFSAYPKPRTAFLEEREDDEDIFTKYDDSACLSWKEILSLVDKYHKVNLFLVEHVTLIWKNFILPKSLHVCMIRFEEKTSLARGDEELQQEERLPMPNISKCTREEREAGA
jgi:hypothetical protein